MATISVFEHKPIPLGGEDSPLRPVHLRQLERLNRQAGVDLIKLGYKQLRATAYVGVIQLGRVTLQILPKVDSYGRDDGQNEKSVESAVANLLWMLVYAGELPVHENELASLIKRRANIFEILVRIFCDRLIEQVERGLFRTYQRREETLPVLKGRWLLSQHLRRLPLVRDKFLVTYEEFITDNPLNRVFYYTVNLLRTLTRDFRNRQQLDVLRMWFDEVTLLPRVSKHDLDQVTFTRLNAAYQPLFTLACMFLSQEALQLQTGQTQTFTFLFDMNILFERFVAGFLRRHRRQALPGSLQECEILTQGRGNPRWLAQTEIGGGRKVFRLKPDLLLRRPDRTIALVVDTKYKTQPTVKEADAYQMHTYADRHACADVLLLYPEAQMTPQTLYIENTADQTHIRLRSRTVGLRHNLSQPEGRDRLATELAEALEGT